MQQLSFVDLSHPEVIKLAAFFEEMPTHHRMHELGNISAIFDLALVGGLVFTNDPKTPIDAIRTDPDIFELRHTIYTKKLRFYHAEPAKHPDLILRLHEHIKVGDSHQQEQIDFAAERYRKKG